MEPQPNPSSEQNPKSSSNAANARRRWTLAGVAAATVAVIGGAFAAHGHARAHGGAFGRHGWHGPLDPESMGRRVDAMVAWMLADIDATPEQRERIATIAKAAANEMAPLRQRHFEARSKSLELFAQPTIDRAQLEALRVEQLQLGDTVTRRMLQAMLDAAEVLNPDQRTKLVERWKQRRARRG